MRKRRKLPCQRGKVCPKQPADAPAGFPWGKKVCTGCDKTGKDKKGSKKNV